MQRPCRLKACSTRQLPTAALCLFDITVLSTFQTMLLPCILRLSCTLALIFQACLHCSSPVCMHLASTVRLSYCYVILILSFTDLAVAYAERSEELPPTAPSHSRAGGPFSAKTCWLSLLRFQADVYLQCFCKPAQQEFELNLQRRCT